MDSVAKACRFGHRAPGGSGSALPTSALGAHSRGAAVRPTRLIRGRSNASLSSNGAEEVSHIIGLTDST